MKPMPDIYFHILLWVSLSHFIVADICPPKKNVFPMTDFYLAQNKTDIINDQNKSVLFKPADTNLSTFHFLQWEYFHL